MTTTLIIVQLSLHITEISHQTFPALPLRITLLTSFLITDLLLNSEFAIKMLPKNKPNQRRAWGTPRAFFVHILLYRKLWVNPYSRTTNTIQTGRVLRTVIWLKIYLTGFTVVTRVYAHVQAHSHVPFCLFRVLRLKQVCLVNMNFTEENIIDSWCWSVVQPKHQRLEVILKARQTTSLY